MAKLSPAPIGNRIEERGGLVGLYWQRWFQELWEALTKAPQALATSTWTLQAAAISATSLLAVTSTGLYRVSWALRVTRVAGTSSSVRVTIAWTDGAQACAVQGASVTGNTLASTDAGSLLVRADTATTVTVAAAYTSVGSPTMAFGLSVLVESLP